MIVLSDSVLTVEEMIRMLDDIKAAFFRLDFADALRILKALSAEVHIEAQ